MGRFAEAYGRVPSVRLVTGAGLGHDEAAMPGPAQRILAAVRAGHAAAQ
jgi:hypothetical protein